MKPLLSLGTVVLAIGVTTMPAGAEACATQDFGSAFAVCPPSIPPVEQPKSRPAPAHVAHVAKRQRHIDLDEKAPPAKPPPALPSRIDGETALHAPAGAGVSAQAEAK